MYAEFFGLRELPFNNTPDPRFFYSTPDHEEALASLVYATQERKGFVLLSGEVGTGKTLVSRMMLRNFGSRIAFANINHVVNGASDLLESVCVEFELPVEPRSSHTKIVRVLHDFLLAKFAQDVPVVLLLDEAQNLPTEAFEQLRTIGNLEADDAKLLQIVIVGQPELQQRFQSQELRQLRQRLFRSFHLSSLTLEHTTGYIEHRLSVVGAPDSTIFDRGAVEIVYQYSRGLPREINTICDNAMLSAYAANSKNISASFLKTVVEQMNLGQPAPATTATTTTNPVSTAVLAKQLVSQPVTTVAANVPELNSGQVESLSIRLAEIEGRLQAQKQSSTNVSSQVHDVLCEAMNRNKEDIASIRGQMHTDVHELNRRIAQSEKQMNDTRGIVAVAQKAAHDLSALLTKAENLSTSIDQRSESLDRRDTDLKQTGMKFKRVIGEVRRVFDRLRVVASQTHAVERRAQRVSDQLKSQTSQARAVVDGLTNHLRSIVPANTQSSKSVRILKEATMRKDEVLTHMPKSQPFQADRTRMMGILDSTRESVSELRGLVVDQSLERKLPTPKIGGQDDENEPVVTSRLANEVEGLLQMIED